jgi:hypothetical protein
MRFIILAEFARPLISVSDETELSDLHDVFQQVVGWSSDLGVV